MINIDGYDDLEVIGRGGFATVYRARQVSVGREVAIKVLTDPMPDQDLVRRFERESKAVGALSWHPNIAAVVDAGRSDEGQAYIVFELLARGSLEDQIATNPMPWPDAVTAMIQVADATEAAHREDVLHRDIKPANILVTRLGDAKLADFGIASMQDGTKTETGMLATSIAHAAPELFDGTPSSVATDVYALGSTLFTLLTGQTPFAVTQGERIVTTIARIAQEPPPLLGSNVAPPPVAAIIVHALAKQPEYRMRSAADFGRALQNVQRHLGLAVTAMPIADAGEAPSLPSPHPAAGHQPPGRSKRSKRSKRSNEPIYVSPQSASVAVPQRRQRKPLARTIAFLAVLAGLLAALVGGALLFDYLQEDVLVVATTEGGVEITKVEALADTLVPGRIARFAVDQDETTFWGIQATADDPNTVADEHRNIVGTTYVITLAEGQTITQVGISNGINNPFGRVAKVSWASSEAGLQEPFTQDIRDEPGPHIVPHRMTETKVWLRIFALHDPDAPRVGIAEILLVAG